MKNFKVTTLVFGLGLFASSVSLAEPCGKWLVEFSLDKVLTDYAQLALAAEEAPANSAASVVLFEALKSKGGEILNLINADEKLAVKTQAAKKISALRLSRMGILESNLTEEAQARLAENDILKISFVHNGNLSGWVESNGFTMSPDGKSFFVHEYIRTLKGTKVMLFSTATGEKLVDEFVKNYDEEEIRFLYGGRFFQTSELKFYPTLGLFSIDRQRTLKVFNTQSGKLVGQKKYYDGHENDKIFTQFSPEGLRLLKMKGKQIEIFDLITNKKIIIDTKAENQVSAEFDNTGENLIISEWGMRGPYHSKATSMNIKTRKINWSKDAQFFSLIGNAKYVLQVLSQTDKLTDAYLLETSTGKELLKVNTPTIDPQRIIISSDEKMIFFPYKDLISGYAVDIDGQEPGFTVGDKKTRGYLQNIRFIDNNTKLSAAVDGQLYIWSIASGVPLPVKLEEARYWFGVDSQGNLLGGDYKKEFDNVTISGVETWRRDTGPREPKK